MVDLQSNQVSHVVMLCSIIFYMLLTLYSTSTPDLIMRKKITKTQCNIGGHELNDVAHKDFKLNLLTVNYFGTPNSLVSMYIVVEPVIE